MESGLIACAALGILVLSPAPGAQGEQVLETVVERHENGAVHSRYTVDAAGKRTGEYREYDDGGNLVLQARYKDDKRHGNFKSFHQNGKRKILGS